MVDEVTAVGRAAGVDLSANAADASYETLMTLPPGSTSSMQRDFAADHRVELEHITGAVVREARRLGVTTPAFTTLYAVLKARALAAGLV
jgi:2-dehydropantoate 2-reductase